MTISSREKKILLIVFGVLILVASYFLIFTRKTSENETLQLQNSSLQAKVVELQGRIAKEQEMKEETERMGAETKAIVYSFPAFLRPEDGITDTISMEENQKIEVTSLTIAEAQLLSLAMQEDNSSAQAGGESQSTEASDTDEDANGNDSAAADGSAPVQDSSTSADAAATLRYTVYEVNSSLSYECDYKSLKDLLGLFEDHSKRRSIQEVMATYDSSTGELDGTMSYNSYFMFGSEKPYGELVPDVSIGTDNVFGTIEKK